MYLTKAVFQEALKGGGDGGDTDSGFGGAIRRSLAEHNATREKRERLRNVAATAMQLQVQQQQQQASMHGKGMSRRDSFARTRSYSDAVRWTNKGLVNSLLVTREVTLSRMAKGQRMINR
jgi:hypothetical protein